jgi:hypothetical protein
MVTRMAFPSLRLAAVSFAATIVRATKKQYEKLRIRDRVKGAIQARELYRHHLGSSDRGLRERPA